MKIKIGSLNCQILNKSVGRSEKIAEIILSERFDIIALQECQSPYALDSILNHLGKMHWAGDIDTTSRKKDAAKDFAFIWNTDRIEVLKVDTPKGVREAKPTPITKYKKPCPGMSDLIRNPYFGRFKIKNYMAEIRLINCHLRFSKGTDIELGDDAGAITRRKNELAILTKDIFGRQSDMREGDNIPSYTILLGDYNLNLRESAARSPYMESIIPFEGRLITTIQTDLSTLKQPPKAGETPIQGDVYANNYDHFTYDTLRIKPDDRRPGLFVAASRIDTVNSAKYYAGNYIAHRKEVSDHVPVLLTLEFTK